MRLRSTTTLLWIALMLPLGPRAVSASPNHIIICGSGGEETYTMKFATWGGRLRTAIVDRLGRSIEDVVLLTEAADGATTPPRTSNLETIQPVLKKAVSELGPKDDLFIYLIGHGSHLRRVSRFHIPGPDLTADELNRLFEPASVRQIVLINAASSSAGFINTLSKPGRVICTATKSVEERNATEFMEYFIQALEDGSADQNRDERISVLEACRQAAVLTDAYYLGKGLISTEHALLDDNGDGKGIRLADEPLNTNPGDSATSGISQRDGALADRCFLKDFSFPDSVPRELVDRYLSTLDRVEQLKRKKAGMETETYYADLETLLIEAAKAHREIRRAGTP